ncbi:MAG TPA: hypothetical protein VF846_08455 [Thermoanaerobaculia bacterium]|jgi:hypothetical protein
MSNVILNFEGLILHHELSDGSRRAIVVATHGKRKHRPFLIARTLDTTDNRWDGVKGDDCVAYPLTQRPSIFIENLNPGKVTLQPLFETRVPHLPGVIHHRADEVFADDELDDEVQRGRPHRGVVAYVHYSSGTVDVTACYEEQGVYDPPGDAPQCFAKIVTFTGATTDNSGTRVTLRDAETGAYITVPDGTTIDVQNICDDGGSDHKEYKKLLKRDSAVFRELIPAGKCGDCKEQPIKGEHRAGRDLERFGVSIGCANNQWP